MGITKRRGMAGGRIVFVLLLALGIVSCGGKKEDPKPDWVYKEKSIEIHLHADPMLNEVNSSPNVLMLIAYQLDTMNKFQEYADYDDGLKTLLKGENFDASVKAIKKLYVDPKQEDKLVLDRAEGAKWVAFIAGYYHLAPGRVTCFFEIPYKVEKQGMIFFKEKVAVIEDPKLNLFLEPQQLVCRVYDEAAEKKKKDAQAKEKAKKDKAAGEDGAFSVSDQVQESAAKKTAEQIYKHNK